MQEKKDILFKPSSELIDKEYVDYVLNYIIDTAEKSNNTFRDKIVNLPEYICVNPEWYKESIEWYEESIEVNSKVINTGKLIKKKLEQEEPLTYEEMYNILEIMYDLGVSDEKIRQRDQKTWLVGAKVGDTIFDKLTEKRGELQQIKPSPEGSILYIKFDKNLVKINLLKEIREPRRYYRVL